MKIDVQTLVIILGFTHLMQVLVFFHQYKVNKSYAGPGWWLLWSAAEVVGFGAMLFRNIPSLLPVMIVLQNSMIVAGTVFLYIGVRRFLEKPVKLVLILPVVVAFMIGLLYFLFVDNNIQVRSAIINATLAVISLFTAQSLFFFKTRAIRATAVFNAAIFFIHGCIFVYRTVMILCNTPVDNVFSPTFFNILPFFDAIIVSLLWTFGLIIMLNQRLNAGLSETMEDLQIIFNTSPDAAVITRLEDGLIVDINEGYTTITGYTREDMAGKSSIEINIWKNADDRQEIVRILKDKGFCENFEAIFRRKDGTEFFGLMSAKVISLQGVPHIISISRDITERKQAEKILQDNEIRLRSVLDATPFPVAIVDLHDNNIEYWSQSAKTLFGHTAPTANEWYRIAYPDPVYRQKVVERWKPALENAKQSGQSVNTGEYHITCHDGSVRICELYVTFLPDYLIVTFNDISRQKKALENLKESEQKFRETLMNLDEGFYSVNLEGVLLDHNQALCRILGFDATADIIGQKLPDFWQYPEKRHKYIDILISKGSISNFLIEAKTKAGLKITVLASAHLVKDKELNPLRIEGVFLDITERNRAEEELRLSAAKFKNVFDHASIGKSLTSPDGSVLVNQAFCKMVGYSSEEMSAIKWKEITHPDDIERDNAIKETIIRGENEQARWIKRYIHKDGSVIWVDISTVLQRDHHGQPMYFITTINDITAQVLMQEKLQEAFDKIKDLNETLEQRVAQRTAQLEASNQELEAFTYSVSHDLRAPLRHISGYVDLLAKRFHSSLTEQGIHYLDSIAGSANQMGTLIDDLLQFSRTGRQEMRETDVDMNNLLQEVMETMRDECSGRSINWVVARLPGVFADQALMRLVWVNLLSNAIKFTRPRKSARIEIGCQKEEKEFVFFVRDNGAGFDMQYAHKLFGVFQRLHSAEEFEGTGIGLANVRRIILRHGGRTWAEAKPDQGATFYFTLPVA